MVDSQHWAHLVGSVPLPDAESVFRTVAGELGPYLKRIPDGETGERSRWIWWQREMMEKHPAMEINPEVEPFALYQWDGQLIRETPWLRLKPGADPSRVRFELGYSQAAQQSYQLFARLKEEGIIGPETLFQVSLPTPFAPLYMYVSPNSRDQVMPIYESAMAESLEKILQSIPHDQLSIQWDVCQEVLIFEDYFPDRPADYKEQVLDELARVGQRVPESVDMGYHFCYGSPRDEHLVMPKDMGVMVEITNGVASRLSRRMDFLHLPVPQGRKDESYYKPLKGLQLGVETQVILGLVHFDDQSGDSQRMVAATQFLPSFGVATECGWGRTDPARVTGLLESHRKAVTG